MKKIWSALLLLVLVLAVAGIASAETEIQLDTPTTVQISIPRDAAIYEFTPQSDGYYRFFSDPWGEGIWHDTMGWLLDADKQLIKQNHEEDGCFSIPYRLNGGETYYLAASFYGWNAADTGSFTVQLERVEGVYARAKSYTIYTPLGRPGTAEVEAYSLSGGLTYQWYDGENAIAGATDSKYTFPALTEAKTFKCVVTDAAQSTAQVIVQARIDSEVFFTGEDYATVEYGGSATLSVNATAKYGQEALTYQWYEQRRTSANVWEEVKLEGETAPTIQVDNVTYVRELVCQVTDINGDIHSRWIWVSIPGGINITPVGDRYKEAEAGSDVTFEVSATSEYEITSYQWCKVVAVDNDYEGYDNWIPIDGATGASYTLENVQASGRYGVQVSDSIGNGYSVEFGVTVNGVFSAEAKNEEDEISVNPGESATLEVDAHGYGELTYQWYSYHQGLSRYIPVNGATTSTLTGNLKASDYYCMVSDGAGNKDSVWFYVTVVNDFSVEPDPSVGADEEGLLYLLPGETKELKVLVNGNGNILYRWYRVDTESAYESSEVVARTETYTITGGEIGFYECVVTDEYGNSGSVYYHVRVENAFEITPPEQTSFTVNMQEPVPVTMSVEGSCTSGNITYRWSHTDPNTYRVSVIKESTENSLTIESVGPDSYGEYYVYAYDEYGNNRTVYFGIAVENHLTAYAEDDGIMTVDPGTEVDLHVIADCDDGALSYVWYQQVWTNGGDSWYYQRMSDNAQSTLHLTAQKAKRYYCYVRDEYGRGINVYFQVRIENELTARAKNGRSDFTVEAGETVNMEVVASCKTGTLSYQWYQQLSPEENGTTYWTNVPINGATAASYIIESANWAGNYFCRVSDEYGNTAETWFNLYIENGLRANAKNNQTRFTIEPGETVTMEVEASCTSGELTYQWYTEYSYEQDGRIQTTNRMIEGATNASYTAGPLTRAGDYYCRVRDEYGNSDNVWFYVYIDNGLSACAKDNHDTFRVGPGETATMEVTASCISGGLTYEWYKEYRYEENGDTYWNTERIYNATNVYTSNPMTRAENYYCRIYDEYGNRREVWFYIHIDNEFSAEEKNGKDSFTVEPGETLTLEVEASCASGALHYQWYEQHYYEVNGTGHWSDIRIDGATGAAYVTDPITKAVEYYCRVSDDYGNSTDIWFYIEIENELRAEAKDDQHSFEVEPGETVTLEVEASCTTGELSYQWYHRYYYEQFGERYCDDERIDGATGAAFAAGPITGNEEYFCRVSDSYGNSTNVWFYIRIENALTAEQLNGEGYLAAQPGESVTLTVVASCANGELTYQWYHRYQYEEDGYTDWDEEPIYGATGETYVTGPITQQEEYYCRVSDVYGNSTNVWFYVSIDNGLTVVPVGLRTRYVEAGTDVELAVAADCNNGELTYEWYEAYLYEDENGNSYYRYNGTVVGNENSYLIQNISQRKQLRCEVTDQYGSTESIEFNIYIDNELEFVNTIYDNPVLIGEQAVIKVFASCKHGGITYEWYKYVEYEENGEHHSYYAKIEDATESTYTTEAMTKLSEYYECYISDEYGNRTGHWFGIYADTGLTAVPDGRSLFSITETPITLAVSANNLLEGSEITYRWYDNNYNMIDGETGSTCTLTNPETGTYYCDVSDGEQSKRVWFYITETPYAKAIGDNERPAVLGEEVTLQVEAWSADGEITYQWYDDDGTEIEGATEASFTFTVDGNREPYCLVTGTELNQSVWFRIYVRNNLYINSTGLSRIQVIPAGGSIQLTANVISEVDDPLTYQWYRNGRTISGETGDALTVTEGGEYYFQVNDRFGHSNGETYYCVAGEPETVSEGNKVTGPEEDRYAVYQFIPARTGIYQIETAGWVTFYRANEWHNFMSMGDETRTIQLNAGQIYYVMLFNAEDSFKYSELSQEQKEYSITLQKGQRLRIPEQYYSNKWYYVDHAVSSNRNVIRIDESAMDIRAEGSADVTVTYDNGMQYIYHVTVVTANTMVLPAGLDTIEADAFNGDTSIRFIELGSNVETVESGAFANIGNITVIVEGYNVSFAEGVFTNSNPVVILYDGSSSYYRNHNIPFFYGER